MSAEAVQGRKSTPFAMLLGTRWREVPVRLSKAHYEFGGNLPVRGFGKCEQFGFIYAQGYLVNIRVGTENSSTEISWENSSRVLIVFGVKEVESGDSAS
jgi:hypothetical protein